MSTCTALVFGVVSGGVAAQPARAPEFTSQTEAVRLWISVRDPVGAPVSGLNRDDFVLFDEGQQRSIDLFARPGEIGAEAFHAIDLAVLFDCSASMADSIARSRRAALAFLEKVPDAARTVVTTLRPSAPMVLYLAENRQKVLEWLAGERPVGDTRLYDALGRAIRVADPSRRHVVVVLTDGLDVGSSLSLNQTVERLLRSGTTVYAVQFRKGLLATDMVLERTVADDTLRSLTESTGGLWLEDDDTDREEVFNRILADIASQYLIGFAPAAGKGFRSVQVKVRRPSLKVRHRAGYYPRP